MASSNGASDFPRKIEKRLGELSTRADSIQMVSQYAIHHKNDAKVVVDAWERVLKSPATDPEKRTALLYVCNDIVQNCRRKGADVYIKLFGEILPHLLVYFKEPLSVRQRVERTLKIWVERKVYSQGTVDEFLQKLSLPPVTLVSGKTEKPEKSISSTCSNSESTAVSYSVSDIVAKFKGEALIEKLRQQGSLDVDVAARGDLLKSLDEFDVSDISVISNLKNKSEGKEFCDKFERSFTALSAYVTLLERQTDARRRLVDTLENAEIFYDTQYAEVKKIAHVYNKYLNNVNNVIKKVGERQEDLPQPSEDEDAGKTPSTLDGSESNMDLEPDNERSGGPLDHPQLPGFPGMGVLPLPPMPSILMGRIPPPQALFSLPAPPPPPSGPVPPMNSPPLFRSPQRPMPPFTSPPPGMFNSPPRSNSSGMTMSPGLSGISPNFAQFPPPQSQQPHQRPQMSPSSLPPGAQPGGQFAYPPPQRMVHPSHGQQHPSSPVGSIPTLGGGNGGQRLPMAPRPPLSPMGQGHSIVQNVQPQGNTSITKRKRSFEGYGAAEDGYDNVNSASSNDALIPAHPIMSFEPQSNQGRPISTISTIVGVRRGSHNGAGNQPMMDPRMGTGPPRGGRGTFRGSYGPRGGVYGNFG